MADHVVAAAFYVKEHTMKQYLVTKRFVFDDVPVFLTRDFAKAEKLANRIAAKMDREPVFATRKEERLVGFEVSSQLSQVTIITFGADGRPVA